MEEYYNRKIRNGKRNDKIKSILLKIIYLILIAFIVLETFILIQSKKNPGRTAGVFGVKAFSIISGSMEPIIKLNDVILVKETPEEDLEVGTIITFIQDGDIITHRIIGVRKGSDGTLYYKTKGDANNTEDIEEVSYEDIEGAYITRIPFVGKVFSGLQNKFVLIIIIVVLIIIYWFKQKLNAKKQRRSETRKEYEKEYEKEMEDCD